MTLIASSSFLVCLIVWWRVGAVLHGILFHVSGKASMSVALCVESYS